MTDGHIRISADIHIGTAADTEADTDAHIDTV